MRTVFKLGIVATAISIALFGCGGGSSTIQGGLSGIVTDINGNPVRGAIVQTNDKFGASTVSNSNGSYILNTVQGQNGTVTASLSQGGTSYYGQNFFQVFQGEQTKSVNISLAAKNTLAEISGTIYDRSNNIVGGAQVFGISSSGLSSTSTISDSNGNFTLPNLQPGNTYTVQATAKGFDSDKSTVTLNSNENRTFNFTLTSASGALLNPPTSVVATAYTSPAESTRSTDGRNAVENMKRLISPAYANAHKTAAASRTTPQGNLTEIDLTWTQASDPALYGWGIYNTQGTGTPVNLVTFYNDPLASLFADLEPSLQVGQTYTYGVTSINTLYGQSGGDESPLSNTSSATIVGDLNLQSTDPTGPTFYWNAASGCTQYSVYLFDQYPSIGINSIFNNDSARVSGTSFTYNGPGALVSGATYYFIVVGRDSGGDGVTFSPVGSFIKS